MKLRCRYCNKIRLFKVLGTCGPCRKEVHDKVQAWFKAHFPSEEESDD